MATYRSGPDPRNAPGALGAEASLVLLAFVEELGGTAAEAARAAGITGRAILKRKETHSADLARYRETVHGLTKALRKRKTLDSRATACRRPSCTREQVSLLFRSVSRLVVEKLTAVHEALKLIHRQTLKPVEGKRRETKNAGFPYRSYYLRIQRHRDLFQAACEEFKLRSPRGVWPVPRSLLTRARMKRAAVLEGSNVNRYHTSRTLELNPVWLDMTARHFSRYWKWLCKQERFLPSNHTAAVRVYERSEEGKEHIIAHSRQGTGWRARQAERRAKGQNTPVPTALRKYWESRENGNQLQAPRRRAGRPRSPGWCLLREVYLANPKIARKEMAKLINMKLGRRVLTDAVVRRMLSEMKRKRELTA